MYYLEALERLGFIIKMFLRIKVNGTIHIVEMKEIFGTLEPEPELHYAIFKMTRSLRMFLPPNTLS